MNSNPSAQRPIVLVHGAWHGAWCWAALQSALDERGLVSHAIDLPGHGVSTLPLGDLHGDADHLGAVLDRLALSDVVLVGHSYGGAVITDAAAARTDLAHLVYLTAFALLAGESVMDPLSALPPEATALQACMIADDDGTFTIDRSGAVAAFYAECPPPVAQAAVARLDRQPMATFTQPVRGASRVIPSTYVFCGRDEAIHPNHQAFLATRCGARVDLDTDHSPMISAVDEVADLLADLATSEALPPQVTA
jgi:pimeloyl-ACP methyl ester carboxylesterase